MEKVGIFAGCRTPFVRAGVEFKDLSALDLAKRVVGELSKRTAVVPDELYFSSVLLNPRIPNLAREVIFASGLPKTVPAHFVSNNCISGLVASLTLRDRLSLGLAKVGFAGGVESMSNPSLSLSQKAEAFYLHLSRARDIKQKLSLATTWRPKFILPQAPSPKEPSTGLTMGQHCEITSKEFQISRRAQDEYALSSHKKAFIAKEKLKKDLVSIAGVVEDRLVRGDTSIEKLSKLATVFDRSEAGTLTAGNSSALTDGASVVALAGEGWLQKNKIEPMAWIKDYQYSAIDPQNGLLMAPVFAVHSLLARNSLTFDNIDYFEIHEAFSAQVLATLQAWDSGWKKYSELKPLGRVDSSKLNINGGSLALGHPFSATGGRLLLNASRLLEEKGKGLAIISVCAAGAMGCAVLLERN